MGGKKETANERLERMSAAQRLSAIEPLPPKYQFLISWDAGKKILRFGCGYGVGAVFVYSNRRLEKAVWTDNSAAKLPAQTVKKFMGRSSEVVGSELLNSCREVFRSYVNFCDDRLYSLVTVWTLGTYLYPVFSHFGYLFLHSKFKRSGKTRLEEILSHLCFEATDPQNAPTIPTIRDTAAEGHTVVLDTLERWREKNPESHSAAMELLDAGFRNGGTIMKMVSAGEGQWKREAFRVYAPYVLAAIAKKSLTDTALDRSFTIEMQRKPIVIKKRKYSYFRCEEECAPLRGELYRWALENAALVADSYEDAKLEADVDALELNDRATDIWRPLFAVARVLRCDELWQTLSSLAIEMGRDPDSAEREQVKSIARSLFKMVNGSGVAVGMTSDFGTHLRADGIEVEDRDLHKMLLSWGFAQASQRLDQGPRRAWELTEAKLKQIERENEG